MTATTRSPASAPQDARHYPHLQQRRCLQREPKAGERIREAGGSVSSGPSLQAQNISNHVAPFFWLQDDVWHQSMRGRQSRAERDARHPGRAGDRGKRRRLAVRHDRLSAGNDVTGCTDGLGNLGTATYVAFLGVNRPSYSRRGSCEHQLQRGTDGHQLLTIVRLRKGRLAPPHCAANSCARPAHYASQRPTILPKTGSANSDPSGSQ